MGVKIPVKDDGKLSMRVHGGETKACSVKEGFAP